MNNIFSIALLVITLYFNLSEAAKIAETSQPAHVSHMNCTGGSISQIETWIKDKSLVGLTISCSQSLKTFGSTQLPEISQISTGGKYINAESRSGGGLVDLWISDRIAKDGSASSSTRNMGIAKVIVREDTEKKIVLSVIVKYENNKSVTLPIIK